ncbi:MAG: SDR family NAD(P)-dependent oxidoreductase [Acidimicrobiales bacterium]
MNGTTYPDLAGCSVIVTGAASPGGIGESAVLEFARQGSRVTVVDLDLAGAERVVAKAESDGGHAFAVRADVTKSADVDAMVAKVIGREGTIDVLVNNAGGFPVMRYLGELSDDDWDATIDLNLKSVFLCVRAVEPHMRTEHSGKIINIASVAGRTPTLPDPVHYSAAKGGVIMLSRCLAQEMAPIGVTVNTVAPGPTTTPRFLRIRGGDVEERLKDHFPLGRAGRPEEVAAAIVFLASGEAANMTGVTLDVNGGVAML